MDVPHDELQFSSFYVSRFAASFGFMTVLTLLPNYIEALGATGVTIGLFITTLELERTVRITPIEWAGDRFSKRMILVDALVVSVLAPLIGGWLMGQFGVQWGFFVSGLAALSGVMTFLGVLSWNHGSRALHQW